MAAEAWNLRQTLPDPAGTVPVAPQRRDGVSVSRRAAGERQRPPETPAMQVNDLDDLTTGSFDTLKPLILAC